MGTAGGGFVPCAVCTMLHSLHTRCAFLSMMCSAQNFTYFCKDLGMLKCCTDGQRSTMQQVASKTNCITTTVSNTVQRRLWHKHSHC